MPPRKKKAAAGSVGLDASEVGAGSPPAEVKALAEQVAADGGAALASYRDPYAGQWVVMVSLPIDKVEPTPYQRELSDTHAKRLADVIPKVGRFLDPLIAVRHDGYLDAPMRGKRGRNDRLLRLALAEQPDDPYLHYQLGKDLELRARYAEALSHYQRAQADADAEHVGRGDQREEGKHQSRIGEVGPDRAWKSRDAGKRHQQKNGIGQRIDREQRV